MKKKLLIIACLLPLFAANSVAQIKTDWEEMCLKGKVKSLKEVNCLFVLGDSIDYDTIWSLFQNCDLDFDKLCCLANSLENETNTIKTIYREFDSSGFFISPFDGACMIYQYDNQGRITEKTKRINGMPDVITTYEYDEKGLVEREKKRLEERVTVYDKQGNVIEETYYNEAGNLVFCEQYKFDEQGRRRKLICKGTRLLVIEYDSKGNEIYSCCKDKNFKRIKKTHYVYDENDSVISMNQKVKEKYINLDFDYEEVATDSRNETCKHRRKYIRDIQYFRNENGSIIKKIDKDNYGTKTYVFERDNQDRLLRTVQYKNDDTIPIGICKYQYDNLGRKTEEDYTESYAILRDLNVKRSKKIWEYDAYGRLVRSKETSFDDNLKPNCDTRYYYDEKGNCIVYIDIHSATNAYNSMSFRKIEYY